LTPVSAAVVKTLLVIAASLNGYTIPKDKLPTIKEASIEEMAQRLCGNTRECPGAINTLGIYKDGTDEIWLNKQLIEMAAEVDEPSVIIHELTHWLQDTNKIQWASCPGAFVREWEAYTAQARYIVMVEHKTDPDLSVPHGLCNVVEPGMVIFAAPPSKQAFPL